MLKAVVIFLIFVTIIFMPIALYAHRLEREERERQKAKRRELENVEYITETDYAVGPMRPLDENFKSSGER